MSHGQVLLVSSRRLFEKFMNDRALTLASLLAWGMLNTFLPLLLGILSLVGLVLGDSEVAHVVQERILAALPDAARGLLSDSLASFERAAGVAGLISLGFLLFNGSNFFVSLESVFDLTYHVRERNLVTQRVVSFAALFVVTALFLIAATAAVVGSAVGQAIADLVPELTPVMDAAKAGLGPAISIIGLALILVLLYWLIPNTRHSFRHALPGAALACVLLLLVVRLFPVYVQFFGQGVNVYAAFGTVLLFMFWLYVVGVVLIGGAVLNAFLEDPQHSVAKSEFAARALNGRLEVPAALVDR
jgi:membrane protein